MESRFLSFLYRFKYELLLFGLLQHLFIGIFLTNNKVYEGVIWPVNMAILGISLLGIFSGKERWKKNFRNILVLPVIVLPVILHLVGQTKLFMEWISIIYVLFFAFIFYELIRFMIRPGYINADIISAAVCGYLLMIEISVFLLQVLFYHNTTVFKGIDTSSNASVYMDLVYFCSVTFTSIGFGDIVPTAHSTKLITAFLGIVGQLYTVVLVGILLSKFTTRRN